MFRSEHVTTSEDSENLTPSTSVRVVIPGLGSLSQELSQTFNISDAAHNKSLKVARDMELYEKRASNYRATLLMERQEQMRAKNAEDGENNGNVQEEIVLPDNLDPLDFWKKVCFL